jgi:hypothetical protein
MKNLFIVVAVFISAIASTEKLKAQIAVNMPEKNKLTANLDKYSLTTNINRSTEDISNISARAIKEFSKIYKNIQGVRWEITPDGFAAEFKDDGVINVVIYNKKGYWAASFKKYNSDQVPAEQMKLMKAEYPDYTISGGTMLETPVSNGIPTYIITADNKINIKWFRIFEDTIEEYKVFLKKN